MNNLQTQINQLFDEQLTEWSLAAEKYESLRSVRIKTFDFDNFSVRVHYNPARAVSSFAKLDKANIAARPCFLCRANRPPEQRGIPFKERYEILVNPYPICQRHFTVASLAHEPQILGDCLPDMLDLAKALPDFVILYNGAQAGASAPDHFHFQAVNADFFHMPVDTEMQGLTTKRVLISADKNQLLKDFSELYHELQTDEKEPKMNLFCQWRAGEFVLTVFPRRQHRPRQFFAEGAEKIMLSPGSIDMTGNLIVAREEDFEKITKDDITDIFSQL
ncbi:MAG: DUF4922 domain-containing protein [Prevotellaceae bacterium]|jgi:ATP adenylyltransferase/5',5'''-P-1,P-4-tetraphosphate phosphorylase II|nr:DUF4922 domain-containing protein [Prevotellaceae bacterium]